MVMDSNPGTFCSLLVNLLWSLVYPWWPNDLHVDRGRKLGLSVSVVGFAPVDPRVSLVGVVNFQLGPGNPMAGLKTTRKH